MTIINRDGLTWVAAKDGLGHARDGNEPRTLCGSVPTPTRFAWPIQRMCAPCTALEKGIKAERRRQRGAP